MEKLSRARSLPNCQPRRVSSAYHSQLHSPKEAIIQSPHRTYAWTCIREWVRVWWPRFLVCDCLGSDQVLHPIPQEAWRNHWICCQEGGIGYWRWVRKKCCCGGLDLHSTNRSHFTTMVEQMFKRSCHLVNMCAVDLFEHFSNMQRPLFSFPSQILPYR